VGNQYCKKQRLSSKVTYKRRNGDFWAMRQTVANIYPDLCSKGRKKGVTLQCISKKFKVF
jgi:hypothetical protein